jgi:RNA polymerase sigma-B factor
MPVPKPSASPARSEPVTSVALDGWLLSRYARRREPCDLEELVRRFRPLARRLALRYARSGEPLEDLEQIACVGLVKAVERFDPDRGFAFTSFAVPTILGELKRAFRDTAWSAHVPRAMQERVAELRRVSDDFATRQGRSPTVRELAERTRAAPEEVVEGLTAGAALSPISLDATTPIEDEDAAPLRERMGGEDVGYERVEDRQAIRMAIRLLTDPQREALCLRFEHDLKQSEIAARMGVSQMQVSRLLRAAIERLATVAGHQSRSTRRGGETEPARLVLR